MAPVLLPGTGLRAALPLALRISLGRWMKFEETVEDGGERWSTPHVPALPLQSLFQLRTCLQKGTMLLDLDATSFKEIIGTWGMQRSPPGRADHQGGTRPPGGPYIRALMGGCLGWLAAAPAKRAFPWAAPHGAASRGTLACPTPVADKVLSEEAELQPQWRERLAALLLRQPQHRPTTSPLRLLAELSLSPCRGRHSTRRSHRVSPRCHQPGAMPVLAIRSHA